MNTLSKFLLPAFVVFAVVFGLATLTHKNDTFANSMLLYCYTGGCFYLDEGVNTLCSAEVVEKFPIEQKPWCTSYTITCEECVNYIYTQAHYPCNEQDTAACKMGNRCYGYCNGEWVFF